MTKRIAKSDFRKAPKTRSVDAVTAARQWLGLGIMPVPLRAGTKRPKLAKGWNKLRVNNSRIPLYFEEGDNIGGLWGSPSDWIVDVDLDCDEAVVLAKILLPETFTYGRESRPESHYLFRCLEMPGMKRVKPGTDSEPGGSVLIEVRSTGSQSVLPPSIHPDGDRFEINADRTFMPITRRDLERRVNKIAAGCLLAEAFPEEGARHDFIHALAGGLLWSGWKSEAVREFMRAIFDATAFRESDRAQRERTVENTIVHFEKGNRIAGWTTLSQWLRPEDLKAIRSWLASDRLEDPIPTDLKVGLESETRKLDLNPELLRIPGLVGEIAEWANIRSYVKQPLFGLAVALECVALATQNRYLIAEHDTPLQPYILLLAPTASGKESAFSSIYEFARRIDLHPHVFQGFQSYHALLDQLAEPPHLACWLWDEAARKLKSAARSQSGQDYQILTHLIQMYGRANSFIGGLPGRKNAVAAIDHPFITVLAAAQPAQMIEAITMDDFSMGFVNRFILFDAGDELPPINLERQSIFPARIEDRVKEIRRVDPPRDGDGFVRIRMADTEAYSIFRDFNERCRELAIRGGGWETWGRATQNALIVAGLVAVGVEPKRPTITRDTALWATELLTWTSNRWTLRVEDSSARSVVETHSKQIERVIRSAPLFVGKARGKELLMLRRGLMPRSMVTRLSRHLRRKDLDDALAQLITADLVGAGEVEGIDVFWAKL